MIDDPSADDSTSVLSKTIWTLLMNTVYYLGGKNEIESSPSASIQKNTVTLSHHSKSNSGLKAVASHFQRLIVAQFSLYNFNTVYST